MSLESILTMLGGIGMFLYGMKLMGNSLERAAGAKMERILEKLTSNKAKGVALGAGVTAVIQSSAATIIMVIGFLNAGILRLAQGVPIIMGANIGTTITAQILRMGDINGDNIILLLLKPSSFAPILIIISAFVILMSKKESTKDRMGIFMGLGILFMGMTLMQSSFSPLAETPEFQKIFTIFTNPFLGVLAGMAVTILLQSSSASVGVVQATASTGVLTFAMAAPITIGCNLGKCVTVILASVGVNKDAKRAVTIDVTMCVLGSILFLIVIYVLQAIVGFSFWNESVNMGSVANFHTLFNVAVAVVFMPFINLLITLSSKIVKDKPVSEIPEEETEAEVKMAEELSILDHRFLDTPGVALDQCKKVIGIMCETNRENFTLACSLLKNFDMEVYDICQDKEEFIDQSETTLGDYIVQLTERQLSPKQNKYATELLHTVCDMERAGDHIINIAEEAELMSRQGIQFSEEGMREFGHLMDAINAILETTKFAYEAEDATIALRIAAIEETIDNIIAEMKARHIQRLQNGTCTVERGASFIELLTDIERISDHCNNICTHLIQRINSLELNAHDRNYNTEESSEEFKGLCIYYENEFLKPITGGTIADIEISDQERKEDQKVRKNRSK